jgi:hypothetical protein
MVVSGPMVASPVLASTVLEPHGFDHDPDLVLAHVTCVTDDLLRVTARDEWPARELKLLVECLRAGVLERVAHEERELIDLGESDHSVAHLKRDHVRLRAATEVMARAAAGEGTTSPAHVAAMARALLMQLRRHLGAEQALRPRKPRR